MALVGASVSERQYKQSVSVSLSNVHSRIIACCRLKSDKKKWKYEKDMILFDNKQYPWLLILSRKVDELV